MARAFVNASSQYLTVNTAVRTALPVSASIWYYPTSTAVDCELMGMYDNSGASVLNAVRLECNFSSNNLQFSLRNGTVENQDSGTAAPTLNQWNHIGGTIDSSFLQTVFLNGVITGTPFNTGIIFPTGLVSTAIGAFNFGAGGVGNYTNGYLAHAAFWNVVLTAGEVLALSKGALPSAIRPTALVGYWPLDGLSSPEPDYTGLGSRAMVLQAGPPLAPSGPPVMPFTPRTPQVNLQMVGPAAALGWIIDRRNRLAGKK